MRRRHALTDDQWARIEPLLPPETGGRGPARKPNRKMFEAMVWILKTGAPWRDLPKYFGPWKSVYTRYRTWCKRGVWDDALAEFLKQQDAETYGLDATIVRAHQDATGAKKGIRSALEDPAVVQQQRFTLSWTGLEILPDSALRKGRSTT